jgi:hypothetical protein
MGKRGRLKCGEKRVGFKGGEKWVGLKVGKRERFNGGEKG